MGTLIVYLSGCLSLLLLSALIKFIHKFCWTPICIQSTMRSQGIKGPPYEFIHGNTKEMSNMRNETMLSPIEASHYMLPIFLPHIYSWIKLYGMNFLIWYGPQPRLVVTEPELIKEILNDKDKKYTKEKHKGYMKKILGEGLATSRGEKWSKQRKLANHFFQAESLKSMIPAMIASVNMMLERWRQYEGKEIEVFNEFKILTSEVISRTAFGSNYLEGENIFSLLTRIIFIHSRNEYNYRIPGLGKLLKTGDDIESDKLQQCIRDSIMKIIKNRENNLMTGELETYKSDLLGNLLMAYHSKDENQSISLDDLIDECKTFYIAGHETVTSLLSWTILLLAIHTDWQDKVRQEVLELVGQQNPSPDAISRLKIMGMILNETLRLYSPAVSIIRETEDEVKLGKLIVPAEMEVYIPTVAVHHNPQIWGDDVHLFNPKRFSEGVAKATNNNMAAFLPFGLGPRICVGLNFATIEAKIALSMILQRYRLTLSPSYVHSPTVILTSRPQHGVQVMLHAL